MQGAQRVLVIEDDAAGRRLLEEMLTLEGWETTSAHDGPAGLELAQSRRFDLVLLDLHLPGMGGLEVLGRLGELDAHVPVIILTADNDLRSAVQATKRGAFDYLNKPIEHDPLMLACQRALDTRALWLELDELRGSGSGLLAQMGGSTPIASLLSEVRLAAQSQSPVLITGETGSGKEVVVQALHRKSAQRDRPLIAVDCGAMPAALLESELEGTLFLDEVGNLSHALQLPVLRWLEGQRAAVQEPSRLRLVATTHRDLPSLSREGQFRTDLYELLAEKVLHVPALRDRREDIPCLAQRFLEEASVELKRPMSSIAADGLRVLGEHSWPGNVRELRNVVRQAVLQSSDLTLRGATLAKLLVPGDAR
ncbi:MAG TPA: sigma-54 dependent transcriptional regulator [Polyangiaceae bacterium]|nr:sigma-54 dependent transcriptional regulator [Polyangiaceae bacterium]